MDKQQGYQYFFEQISGLTAYEENSVPDKAAMPYITYQKIIDDLNYSVFPSASIWTRSTSWEQADTILNGINAEMKFGGRLVKLDEGRMWVTTGNPFAQPMPDDEDKMIKRYVLNFQVEFLT